MGLKIRFITPFDVTGNKNIGAVYNEAIAELPDDCWVVLRDGDTLFLTPDWGMQIAEIISANPEFDIFTCMTNRLGLNEQVEMDLFTEPDISAHINRAASLQQQHGTRVDETKLAGGLCLIFRKSVWQKCNFKQNTIIFDRLFCIDARRHKFKIGIARGLYLFHLYRWGQPEPKRYKDHFIK